MLNEIMKKDLEIIKANVEEIVNVLKTDSDDADAAKSYLASCGLDLVNKESLDRLENLTPIDFLRVCSDAITVMLFNGTVFEVTPMREYFGKGCFEGANERAEEFMGEVVKIGAIMNNADNGVEEVTDTFETPDDGLFIKNINTESEEIHD